MPLKYHKPDAETAKLLERVEKECQHFDRWFRRLMRAVRAVDKSFKTIKRLNKQLHAPKESAPAE